MESKRLLAAAAALAAIVAIQLIGAPTAAVGGTATLSLDVAAFAHRADGTTHTATGCNSAFATSDHTEDFGAIYFAGGVLGNVTLPQGATVTRFRFSVADNVTTDDAWAFLLRKRLAPLAGMGAFDGYKVMAKVGSTGASALVRRFTDSTVANATIDNETYAYFVEVTSCGDGMFPTGVQVTYTKP